MKRFDIIKPVENHPDHICCTECWQRGIEWGGAGEQERIIALLEAEHKCEPYFCGIHQVIALIKGEN
jgi:hypothetical protein